MAKRKTPKAEKVVDLTPKAEKLTDEQLKKLQETISNLNKTQMGIGELEVRKHELLHNIAVFRDGLTALQDEFKKEYGTVDINIQNGSINYEENGSPN